MKFHLLRGVLISLSLMYIDYIQCDYSRKKSNDKIICNECSSRVSDVNHDCENPGFDSTTNNDCTVCYTIFNKKLLSSEEFLIRTCMTDDEFNKSKYSDKDHYMFITCNKSHCNSDLYNYKDVKELVGDKKQGETDEADDRIRICYICDENSGDTHCDEVNWAITKTIQPCTMKPCATFFSQKNGLLSRSCESYDQIRSMLSRNEIGFAVEWCETDRCNMRPKSSFPGCNKTTTSGTNEWQGCVEVGIKNIITTHSSPTEPATTEKLEATESTNRISLGLCETQPTYFLSATLFLVVLFVNLA